MLFAQQVVDGLHGIEGAERHFHEDGVPVAHGSIPQAGQLQGFQLLAVLALAADEPRGLVNKVGQVERTALVVLDSTDEVDGIEVGALGEHTLVLGIALVDLAGLQDLQADGAVLIIGEERAAARLAHVLDDAADTHRTVQLLPEVDNQLGILQFLDVGLAAAEVALHETDDFLEVVVGVGTALQLAQIGEGAGLQSDEDAGDELFVGDGVGFQAVGNDVVDVLDEDDVGVNLVEVLDECAVATGTEQQGAVVVAERGVVGVGGDGVGAGLLLGESDVELDAVLLGVEVGLLGDFLTEQLHVLMGDGEVDVGLAVAGGIEGALDEVLLHRRARTVLVVVEQEQSFRQLTVVQSFGVEHVGDNGLVVAVGDELHDFLAVVGLALVAEGLAEGKLLDVVEKVFLEVGGRHVVVGAEEGEHVLEHAAGRSGGRYELHDFPSFGLVGVPRLDIGVARVIVGSHNAATDGCRGLEPQEREAGFEVFKLLVEFFF